MNLLELIELRAKSWQISNDINTYYKHKASDVQVFIFILILLFIDMKTKPLTRIFQPDIMNTIDLTLLGTSPPATTLTQNLLGPGEVIRTSGKFPKPTKIPGKNYSKDEIVIRNADSGKGTHSRTVFNHNDILYIYIIVLGSI